MESEPEPTGAPPTYSEATGNESAKIPCGENDDGKIYPKQPQYTWAEPIPNQCHLGESLQYPPVQPSPGPGATAYGPAYGQPMLTYYQQPGYGTPYYGVGPSQHQQQQVMMVGGQQHHQPVLIQHVQSFAGHVVLSCIVIFCCNFVLGFIAFVLACKHPLTFHLYCFCYMLIVLLVYLIMM